ncbi:MAG: addiction module protein [Deltaproteobacteria bacterium]|jgi:putative addiction module component (TIGR02574 family)
MSIAEIKNDVSRLPAKERAALACWIISNLDVSAEENEAVDLAWREEVRSRVDAIKAGTVDMIPAGKMWEDILNEYGKAR